MPEFTPIPPSDLLLDAENPRRPDPNLGQHEVLQEIAQDQGKKLQALATDILRRGLDPTSLPIVTPLGDDLGRYLVLEGNRRLTALRALENPEFLVDVIPKAMLAAMRRLSKEYHESAPVESVQCAVFADREDANYWIELRHTGENGGVGVVTWDSDEKARFKSRGGTPPAHIQVLDFLEKRGDIKPETRLCPTRSVRLGGLSCVS